MMSGPSSPKSIDSLSAAMWERGILSQIAPDAVFAIETTLFSVGALAGEARLAVGALAGDFSVEPCGPAVPPPVGAHSCAHFTPFNDGEGLVYVAEWADRTSPTAPRHHVRPAGGTIRARAATVLLGVGSRIDDATLCRETGCARPAMHGVTYRVIEVELRSQVEAVGGGGSGGGGGLVYVPHTRLAYLRAEDSLLSMTPADIAAALSERSGCVPPIAPDTLLASQMSLQHTCTAVASAGRQLLIEHQAFHTSFREVPVGSGGRATRSFRRLHSHGLRGVPGAVVSSTAAVRNQLQRSLADAIRLCKQEGPAVPHFNDLSLLMDLKKGRTSSVLTAAAALPMPQPGDCADTAAASTVTPKQFVVRVHVSTGATLQAASLMARDDALAASTWLISLPVKIAAAPPPAAALPWLQVELMHLVTAPVEPAFATPSMREALGVAGAASDGTFSDAVLPPPAGISHLARVGHREGLHVICNTAKLPWLYPPEARRDYLQVKQAGDALWCVVPVRRRSSGHTSSIAAHYGERGSPSKPPRAHSGAASSVDASPKFHAMAAAGAAAGAAAAASSAAERARSPVRLLALGAAASPASQWIPPARPGGNGAGPSFEYGSVASSVPARPALLASPVSTEAGTLVRLPSPARFLRNRTDSLEKPNGSAGAAAHPVIKLPQTALRTAWQKATLLQQQEELRLVPQSNTGLRLQALPTHGKLWAAPAAKWHFARRDTTLDETDAGVRAMVAFLHSIAFDETPFVDVMRTDRLAASAPHSPGIATLAALCAPRTLRQWVRWGCPHMLCRAIASSGSQLLLPRPDMGGDGWPLFAPADSAHTGMFPVVVSMLQPAHLRALMNPREWAPPEHKKVSAVVPKADSLWRPKTPYGFLSAITERAAAAVLQQAGYKPSLAEQRDAGDFMVYKDGATSAATHHINSLPAAPAPDYVDDDDEYDDFDPYFDEEFG